MTLCASCQRQATEVTPGLITAAEGQHFHRRISAEVPLEGLKHVARTVRSRRFDNPVN
jgi:hypothetical protein